MSTNVKPGYKLTEVGVIPEEWDLVPIGSIASFTSGSGISVSALAQESSSSPIPVYGGNGIAGYADVSLVDNPVVVIGRVGQKCGEVYLTEGPAWVTDNALYPRLFFWKVDVCFLALALSGAGLNDVKNRNDLPLLTQAILHLVRIPLPPTLAEQEAIAEALSDADALIESLAQLVAKKRHLKQGAMQELLTGKIRLPGFTAHWKACNLGADVALLSGCHVLAQHCNTQGEGVPYLTGPADFPTGKIQHTKYTERPVAICTPNDILVTVKGSGSGTLVMADAVYCISRQLMAIRVGDWDGRFVYYSLLHHAYKINAASTGLIPGLSRSDILEQSIPVPPHREEQTAIAAVLSDMDADIAALEAKLAKARQVKQGMMQELLTGRIRLI